jgi:hypothetical protein
MVAQMIPVLMHKVFRYERPSSSDFELVNLHLPSHCSSCVLLLAEPNKDDDGFHIHLSLPDATNSTIPTATIHLDKTWTIRSWVLDRRGNAIMAECKESDVVRFLLTHTINLKVHTLGHTVTTTLSHMAHKYIPPRHQIHTFMTDSLHSWVAVQNDIMGYHLASLGPYGTILNGFVPDVTSNYLQWPMMGVEDGSNALLKKEEWTPFRSIMDLASLSHPLMLSSSSSNYPSAQIYRDASLLFNTTVHKFVNGLYPSNEALNADPAMHRFLEAFKSTFAPYVAALGIPNVVRGVLSIQDLSSILSFYLSAILVHSEIMRTDLADPLMHWTMHSTGVHRWWEVFVISEVSPMPSDLPVSEFVHDAAWPHPETMHIMKEFQAELKLITNMTYACY